MKMFSFSRPNKRPVGFMTCLKSWLCVDISRYDTSHMHSETVDTTNWINKFPQTLNRNWSSFVHRLLWLHQNQTEDLLVARNEIVSSYFFFFLTDFVHAISRKRLDRFAWNFQDWWRIRKTWWQIFCFDDVTSGREISSILSNLEGLVVPNL